MSDSSSNLSHWGSRLGFACKVAGAPIKTSDLRRPQNHPHLRHSLAMLEDVLAYLQANDLRMFRLPSELCPFATAPKYPEFRWEKQFADASQDIERVGAAVRASGVRLSFHPGQFNVLNSPREEVVAAALDELDWNCRLLDEFGCGPEAVVLVHAGGVYGDRPAARERLVATLTERLPEHVRRRLCLENDDVSWPAADVLSVCEETGVPMIFDFHHHDGANHGEAWTELLPRALATWPAGVLPKTHLSSPRDPEAVPGSRDFRAHADYVDGQRARDIFAFSDEHGLVFDVMLEAKAKDLAVLRLRDDLRA